MQGLLIRNGFLQSASFTTMYDALCRAAEKKKVKLIAKTNDAFCPFIEDDALQNMDFVLFWDKDVALATQFENKGLKVFNSANSIRLCDDKTLSYLSLDGCVPQPKSIVAPLTFSDYTNTNFLDDVAAYLGYPYVIKQGCGSFGQQVHLVYTKQEAQSIVAKMAPSSMLFQAFIAHSFGRDVRLYMVGNACVAAMQRKNLMGDFRANIFAGASAQVYVPTKEEVLIAQTAVKKLGLTFAGVDLLFSEQGPVLCEVNSNAHFTALEKSTGVDVAGCIFEEISRLCKGY